MKRAGFAIILSLMGSTLSAQASHGRVLLVCNPCPAGTGAYFNSAAEAADATQSGDWVLVWPGTYHESVTIPANEVHFRGMDRNRVIFDGEGKLANGVSALGVTDSWIENLSARNYRGNGVYWSDVFGFWGRYLTVTGSHYGIYVFMSTADPARPAIIADSYGGGSDEGFYVGGCSPCHTIITNVLAENNAFGYVGTNAGGDLSIINSEWRNNYTGLAPNSASVEPYFPERGTMIYGNYIHDNNNKNAWGAGVGASNAPVGVGIYVAAGTSNWIEKNRIENHKHYGVLITFLEGGSYFNTTTSNRLANNADADLAVDATSVGNCFERNVGKDGTEPTSDPPMIQTLYNCGRPDLGYPAPPGSPIVTVLTALNMAGITEQREPHAWDAPAQQTMPNPCEGVPNNDWCSDGALTVPIV